MGTETHRGHHQPRVELRAPQPYVAITARARTETEFRGAVDRNMPAVFRWLEARGIAPAGPPFLRYLVVDEREVPESGPPPATFESGVPVVDPVGDGSGAPVQNAVDVDRHGCAPGHDGAPEVHAGVLPAGTWLVVLHRGGYSGLGRAHAVIHDWAAEERMTVARAADPDGTAFAGSVEHFRIGPFEQCDPWGWETEVAYLLVDGPARGPRPPRRSA